MATQSQGRSPSWAHGRPGTPLARRVSGIWYHQKKELTARVQGTGQGLNALRPLALSPQTEGLWPRKGSLKR